MAKKGHIRIRRNCIALNRVIFYKILADISGPFKCDSLGNKYCLMVIETFEYVCNIDSVKKHLSGSDRLSVIHTSFHQTWGVHYNITHGQR